MQLSLPVFQPLQEQQKCISVSIRGEDCSEETKRKRNKKKDLRDGRCKGTGDEGIEWVVPGVLIQLKPTCPQMLSCFCLPYV